MLKVDRSSDYLAWLIDPKPSLLGFCSEFSQIQRSKPDLFNFLNFQGFTYCLIFNYQGSLLLTCSTAALIWYHVFFCLSTTFSIYFFISFETFAALSRAKIIISNQQLFVNKFFCFFSNFFAAFCGTVCVFLIVLLFLTLWIHRKPSFLNPFFLLK